MDQNTYSFPKVSPADPHELRESLRARRRASGDATADVRREDADRRRGRDDRQH